MKARLHDTLGLLLGIWMTALALPLHAGQQPTVFKKWPAGSSPLEIGKRVAERLASTPHSNFSRPGPPPFITYPEVATWSGALSFAQLSGDKDLDSRLIKRFEPLFSEESKLVPDPDHVDKTVFGAVDRKSNV
jgi:unsaturated rhamnogalacturonyl hydrolase